MAVGSRAHLESAAVAKRTWLRNFLMHGFHMLVTFVAGHAVKDTQCGFKVSGVGCGILVKSEYLKVEGKAGERFSMVGLRASLWKQKHRL
jgi:hypothetical protein